MERMPGRPVCWFLGVLLASVSSVMASAQEVTIKPRPVETVTVPYVDASPVWIIRQHLTAGDRDRLRDYALEFVGTLAQHPQLKGRLDPTKSFRLVLLTRDGTGKTVASSVLISQPAVEWGRLPGVGGERNVFEIYLSDTTRSTLSSTWTSKAEENPLATAAGDFVQGALTKVALPSSTLITREAARGEAVPPTCEAPPARAAESRWRTRQPALPDDREVMRPAFCLEAAAGGTPVSPSFTAAVSEVVLPQRRSTITVADAVTIHDTYEYLTDENTSLQWVLRRRYSGNTEMIKLIDEIAGAIAKSRSPECRSPVVKPADCVSSVRGPARSVYVEAKPSENNREHAARIARQFDESSADAPTFVLGQSTISNTPATKYTFAVGTAVIAKAWLPTGEPRIKNQNGNIVADPLGRLTAFAVVNWFPAGFQPRTGGVAKGEAFRFFGGSAIAPYFGPVAGVGWGFTRALAVNVGGGWILTDAMPANRVGTPVKAGESFNVGWVPIAFVGASVKVGK